jgi:hypothetical protein
MTAVELLIEQITSTYRIHLSDWEFPNKEYFIEMEKQQIIDAFDEGKSDGYKTAREWDEMVIFSNSDHYYNETYGSKGSDETNGNNVEKVSNVVSPFLEGYEQINQDNPVARGSTALVRFTSSQTEIPDAGKDTADYIDRHIIESMKELAREGFKPQVSEISDEEIEKYAKQNAFQYYEFITGAKWYREQLKQRQ